MRASYTRNMHVRFVAGNATGRLCAREAWPGFQETLTSAPPSKNENENKHHNSALRAAGGEFPRTVPLGVVPVGGVAPGPGPDAELGDGDARPAQRHLAALLPRRGRGGVGRHRLGRPERPAPPDEQERQAAAGDLQGPRDHGGGQ